MTSQAMSQMGTETQLNLDSDFESQALSQSQSQSQSSSQFSKETIPKLYGVYLLNSLSKKTCFYVGSTPDPVRRLRQHNGELTRGGAVRTKKQGYRPWRMILYVYGFPSKIAALQFEHAWQHAYQCRHIPFERRLNPGKRHTGSGTSLHGKLANCRLLLSSPSFKRLGLKVAIFNDLAYDTWLKNRYGVEVTLDVQLNVKTHTEDLDNSAIVGGNYNQLKEFMASNVEMMEAYFQKCINVYSRDLETVQKCTICSEPVYVTDNGRTLAVCANGECECTTHMVCLSKHFIKQEYERENQNHVLPLKGKCPKCETMNFWNLVVRGSANLQERMHSMQ